MATASYEQGHFNQILQCTICLDKFKRPMVLPCGHTFCASCLQLHINSKLIHNNMPQASFPCPECGAITITYDPMDADEWSELFSVNSSVVFLGQLCYFCLKRTNENPATTFCRECNKFMCGMCKEYHDDFSMCNHHRIFNFTCENKSIPIKVDLTFIEMCSKHTKERIQFFCVDHCTLFCSTCGFQEHRTCEAVVEISEMGKTMKITNTSKEVKTNLQKCLNNLKQLTKIVEGNSDNLKKDQLCIIQQIRSLKTQFNTKLERLVEECYLSIDRNKTSEESTLSSNKARGIRLMRSIENDLDYLQLVMTHGSHTHKAILLHNLDLNQHRYTQAINEYTEHLTEARLTFDVADTIQELLNKRSILGTINVVYLKDSVFQYQELTPKPKVKHAPRRNKAPPRERRFDQVSEFSEKDVICSKLDLYTCPNFKTEQEVRIPSISKETPPGERKTTMVSEFRAKVVEDINPCTISDILQLPDSRILLTDNGNNAIKMFKPNYQYKDSLKFEDGPWGLCALSELEVAVTVPYQKTIHIIKVTDQMRKFRKIKTRLQCWSMATLGDQLMICTWSDKHCILILNMKGTEIKTIQSGDLQHIHLLYPSSIVTDLTKSNIYVSYHQNILAAYDLSWNVVYTYDDETINGPGSVDFDKEANMYLCGYFSCNVKLISADRRHVTTLISKSKEQQRPLKVKFCNDRTRFFVTYKGCDIIEVYELGS